ncbi:hypothetical protein B0T24DRAFT_635466 [Lasiosphaeria ovina]|uniref:Uncharacterized protein n=1 Tax=Lasiosphaeria ovina TaxID=92902 RepID=A0AAE0K0A2_9PEZI|nr:hypothetical protein B0T24DRAFT_635466 [Lasiosphaeria ovina]
MHCARAVVVVVVGELMLLWMHCAMQCARQSSMASSVSSASPSSAKSGCGCRKEERSFRGWARRAAAMGSDESSAAETVVRVWVVLLVLLLFGGGIVRAVAAADEPRRARSIRGNILALLNYFFVVSEKCFLARDYKYGTG